jgi:hypothetical protein
MQNLKSCIVTMPRWANRGSKSRPSGLDFPWSVAPRLPSPKKGFPSLSLLQNVAAGFSLRFDGLRPGNMEGFFYNLEKNPVPNMNFARDSFIIPLPTEPKILKGKK